MDGTLTITIDLRNDATREPEDIADALADVARDILDDKMAGVIRDANGNRIGTFNMEED